MSGSQSCPSRFGALVLALGLTAPAGVLLALPASASAPVAPLEGGCGLLLGLPPGPHDVLVSITAADGTALEVADQGRLAVAGRPQPVEVPVSAAEAPGPYVVHVTLDDVAQPAVEVDLPECVLAAPVAAPAPSPSAPASPSPSASASPTASASASPTPSASASASPAPTVSAPTTAVAASASVSPAPASPSAAPLVEDGADEESVVAAAAAPAAAPPAAAPLVGGSGLSGTAPLPVALPGAVAGAGSAAAVVPLPLMAPAPTLPAAAAPPIVALPEGAEGPLLAAPASPLTTLLPELPAAVPTPEAASEVVASTPRREVPAAAMAEALPGALLLAGLVGLRARRRRTS